MNNVYFVIERLKGLKQKNLESSIPENELSFEVNEVFLKKMS